MSRHLLNLLPHQLKKPKLKLRHMNTKIPKISLWLITIVAAKVGKWSIFVEHPLLQYLISVISNSNFSIDLAPIV